MIISEETDYFIYGCISTLFVQGLLCILYGCCFEIQHKNKYCKMITNCCKKNKDELTYSGSLITNNTDEFDNSFKHLDNNDSGSPTGSYFDL